MEDTESKPNDKSNKNWKKKKKMDLEVASALHFKKKKLSTCSSKEIFKLFMLEWIVESC